MKKSTMAVEIPSFLTLKDLATKRRLAILNYIGVNKNTLTVFQFSVGQVGIGSMEKFTTIKHEIFFMLCLLKLSM